MYKKDSALNDLQWLICYKTQSNQTKSILVEEQEWYYLMLNWRNKRVHIFTKHISSKVNRLAQQEFRYVLCVALCPVVGRSHAAQFVRVFHHWIHHLWPQGAVPPGFNPLQRGWVYRPTPEVPRKGECRWGPRHFWKCLSCWAAALRQDPP